ncbi:MAG TPA: hypothetical protein VN783_11385 [Thermoanaerobaculia bacterium]|nr:hypothetical protein [Thermoanaerobaculia bacterium]
MVKRSAIGLILGCLLILSAGSAFAGGYQEVTDITNVPTSIPGTVYANYVPLHWDARCIPVTFRMNNTLDPIPNPLGAAFLSYANAKAAIQSAANSWNAIPTSYIQFNFGPDVANAGNRKFDMINEITFRTGPAFNFFASFFPVRLAATSTLNNGDDLDGDGDSDVSSSITQCTDFDGDGDIEFPAGTYDAGTIIELDIAFNTKSVPPAPAGSMGVRWTVTDDIPTLTGLINFNSLDLEGEAALQFGFAQGLAPSSLPEVNRLNNPDDSTMYPFRDWDDPISLVRKRTLEWDDKITSSVLYPEGSAASGPAAIQAGDVAFSDAFGVIEGSVLQSAVGLPMIGGNVTAQFHGPAGTFNVGDEISAAYTGHARIAINPTTFVQTNLPPAEGVIDGKYFLAVPYGTWDLNLEGIDGVPQSAAQVGNVAILAAAYNMVGIPEEFWSGPGKAESAKERDPGESVPVTVSLATPHLTGIDFVTNKGVRIANAGAPNVAAFNDPPGTCFAVQFPITELIATDAGRGLNLSDGFLDSTHNDMSGLIIYQQYWLAYGSVSGSTATIDLAHPLETKVGPMGQQMFEAEPWYFQRRDLLKKIIDAYDRGQQTDVFLVGKTISPATPSFTSFATRPVIDLRSDGFVPLGESFIATDCVNFTTDPTRLFEIGLDFTETNQTLP